MDEKQIGRDIGAWIAASAGGKGKVAFIAGPPGAPTFKNLTDGVKESFAKQQGMQVVFEQYGALTRERGLKLAEDALTANPDLVAIYTANDDVALGAAQAVQAAGKKGKVAVTGMNGIPPALRAVGDGTLSLTVELNPVNWGRLGVDVLAGYLKGEKYKQQVFIKHELIDAKNIGVKMPKS
jgi:ABC-type sugar transport system substrate-binding protein